MKRLLLGLVLCVLLAVPVTAQNSQTGHALTLLAELPGVSGYEEPVSQWLAEPGSCPAHWGGETLS